MIKIKQNYENNNNFHIEEWFSIVNKENKTVGSLKADICMEIFTKNFLGRPSPLSFSQNNNSRRLGSRSLTPSRHDIDANLTTVTPVHGPHMFGVVANENSEYNFFSTDNSNDSLAEDMDERGKGRRPATAKRGGKTTAVNRT